MKNEIDVYLLDAYQKYGESIGALSEEQQAAPDKWSDSFK